MDIETIRTLCLQLPHTSEGIKYGDQLCFMVAGKSFCSSNLVNLNRVNFKVPDEDFEALCEISGIAPAPYGGARFKWVQVSDFDCLTPKDWAFYLTQSYQLIRASLPKKIQLGLNNV